MFTKPIVTDSIESGLDRKSLKDLKRRLFDINSERLKNTRDALSLRHKSFLDVLPLLLHTNHPLLPGYISHNAPAGIIHYEPSELALKTAKMFGRSFTYNPQKSDPSINAVFIMGSVGTIAYSKGSDLDIWVCHNENLNNEQLRQLDYKCSLIEKWAEKINLETHFFTMNSLEFLKGKNKKLSQESSGSSQHFLLLDEFYRSAISLAGQAPSWWYVPPSRHKSYENYLNILLTKRYMPADQILDFGVIIDIPKQEFISAGIWQLYKAIESPYKSLIKLLLLESYANPSSSQRTISENVKSIIYNGDFKTSDLDPYIMSYRYIEEYLNERREYDRLHLIRRCLYFKINKPLTKPITHASKSWQREILESLVEEWKWSENYLKYLDNRRQWKAPNVIIEKKSIVLELQKSYQFLNELSDINKNNDLVITEEKEELNTLRRKLEAYYKTAKGKIEKINPNISLDLSEPFLTFMERYDKANDEYYWSVYADRIIDQRDRRKESLLKKSPSIVELILWCYFNNILTSNTYIDCHKLTTDISKELISQIITDLKYWQPMPLPSIAHESYQKASHITHVMIIINADQQPNSRTIQKGIHHITGQSDILNHSSFNENLIKTIDMVTMDNWKVIKNIRLTDNCLTACLYHYLSISTKQAQDKTAANIVAPPIVSVLCHTPTFGNALQQRLKQLLTEISNSLDASKNKLVNSLSQSSFNKLSSRYVFSAENKFYVCELKNEKPVITSIKSERQLIRYFSKKRKSHSPFLTDSLLKTQYPLHLISPLTNDQSIHLIYSLHGQNANIYVLDEHCSLFISQLSAYNEQTLLRPLHYFIRSALDRLKLKSFASKSNFDIYPVKFYRHELTDDGKEFLHPNLAISDVTDLPFYNVTAVLLEEDVNINNSKHKQISIEISCNDIKFTSLEYGDSVYSAAAQYIVDQRKSREKYPCYITDIDLSRCPSISRCSSAYSLDSFYSKPFTSPSKTSQPKLQLIHFFAAKSFIERKLNSALFSLPASNALKLTASPDIAPSTFF
ncbi:MAG: class I adenylate cyclase [Cellvibrionaceae bacterium]